MVKREDHRKKEIRRFRQRNQKMGLLRKSGNKRLSQINESYIIINIRKKKFKWV